MELWCNNQVKNVGVKFRLIRDIVSQGVIALEDFYAEDNPLNMVIKFVIDIKFKVV